MMQLGGLTVVAFGAWAVLSTPSVAGRAGYLSAAAAGVAVALFPVEAWTFVSAYGALAP